MIVSVPRIFERLHAGVQGSLNDASAVKRRLFDFTHRIGWGLFEWRQGRGPYRAGFLLWPLLKALVADRSCSSASAGGCACASAAARR